MAVSSLCLALLLFSPVLASLNEEKNGNTLEASLPNGTQIVHKKDIVQLVLTNHTVIESSAMIIEQNSTSVVASTPDSNKRPSNRRSKNRVNQLNQKGSRPSGGRNRRPPNEKKGNQKKDKQLNKNRIRYSARSSHTDQLNKAVDDMLACMSQTLFTQNSTFSLRLNTFRANMKISPWAFVALNKTDTNKTVEIVMDGKRRRTKAASDFKSETVDIDGTESNDDDDNAINLADETTLDSITENSSDVAESSTVPEEVPVTEDDDVVDSTETYSDNITQLVRGNAMEDHRTQEPSPVVLSDDTVAYSLKLLGGNEIENSEVGFFEEELPKQQDSTGRQAKKLDGKRDRGVSRSYSRRPTVKVEGIGLIQRNGDVLVGMRQNSTAHIIETQILIGPLQCVMDKRAGFLLQQSRVSMPQLAAKLRLTEIDGKLVEVRLRPTKVRPNEALVTIRLSENGNVPSNLEAARIVSYLSREMSRVWNSGDILRRVKRQFKQLFIDETISKGMDSKDARKLVQMLVVSAFEEPPSADSEKDNKELSKS